MKREVMMTIMSFFYIISFAQRGRGFRPEWDMDNYHNHHGVDDDMWSFLFVIGLAIIIFAYYYFKGLAVRQKEKAKLYKNNSNTKATENGCCLIYAIICVIAFVAGLVVPWLTSNNSNMPNSNKKTERTQRKDKTIVVTIISENDYKQSHVASKEEFIGKDTCFFYEYIVYQNRTNRDLVSYSLEYNANGSKALEILKNIKPNEYFKCSEAIPFQKPPVSVDFNATPVRNNWKSRSRWANKGYSKKTMFFLDYSEEVLRLKQSLK